MQAQTSAGSVPASGVSSRSAAAGAGPMRAIFTTVMARLRRPGIFLMLWLLGAVAAQAAPSISGFTPTNGLVGSSVAVNGSGFSTTPASNLVKFNGTTATVSASTATQLTVAVPSGASTGKITVTVAGQTATSANNYTLKPRLDAFAPTSGAIGSTVTITGEGFAATPAGNSVAFFNNKTATVTSASATQLVVTVPAGTSTGTVKVTVGANSSTSTASFTVKPGVTSFSPTSGPPDTLVTIAGTGFSATRANNAVAFDGHAATVTSASTTQLVVRVPADATAGKITVTVAAQTGTSAANFFPPPWIDRIVPAGAPIGATVTFEGGNFNPVAANNTVRFNGATTTPATASFTTLQVVVPAGAQSGPVEVDVGAQTADGGNFFVTTPPLPGQAGPMAYLVNSDSVSVYDTTLNTLHALIPIGARPVAIAANPAGTRVYVTKAGDENAVSVIDVTTNAVVATVAMSGVVSDVVVHPGGGKVFVNQYKTVGVIDATTNTLAPPIDVGIGASDYGWIRKIALGADGSRLYVQFYNYVGGNREFVAVVDAATHATIATAELPSNVMPGDAVVSADGSHGYFADGRGQLHIVGDDGSLLTTFTESVPPSRFVAPHIALSADGSMLYFVGLGFTALDLGDYDIAATAPTVGAEALAASPVDARAFVAASPNVNRFILHPTGLAAAELASSGEAVALAVDSAGTRVVARHRDGSLAIVDTLTETAVQTAIVSSGVGSFVLVNAIPADRLKIASVNGTSPAADIFVNVPFDVVVQARSATSIASVATPTTVQLSLAPGSTGSIGGVTHCTMPAGTGVCVVRGVVLGSTQAGAILRATTTGATLAVADSAAFAVIGLPGPTIAGFSPDSGAVGQTVVITGTNFRPSEPVHPTVQFNGTAATVTQEADTSLTVTVPAGATTGPVSVTVGSDTVTSATNFRVKPAPALSIVQITPLSSYWQDPYTTTISIAPVPPATQAPTGTVVVTDHSNGVSCSIVLPATSCSMTPLPTTPKSVFVSASYAGDDMYGGASTAQISHWIAYYQVRLEISDVLPEPSQAGQGSFVQFTIKPVTLPWDTGYLPIGTVSITNGSNACQFGSIFGMSAGGCSLNTPTAGITALTAIYGGDMNYATTRSVPVSHATGSAGGPGSMPAGKELCGFNPNYSPPSPPPAGFVLIDELPAGVPSIGFAKTIVGIQPLAIAGALPADGATVDAGRIDITGTFDGPVNTGITLNGAALTVSGGEFLASDVPLEPGVNTFELKATTLPGATVMRSFTIVRGTGPVSPLRIGVVGNAGATPFAPAVLGFDFSIGNLPNGATVASVAIDFNGDDIWDYQGPSLTGAPAAYTFYRAGAYVAKFKVVDSNNITRWATRALLVQDAVARRSLLCDVHGYLRSRLAAGDAPGAGLAFQPEVRADFSGLFASYGSGMSSAAARLGRIVDGNLGPYFSDMRLVRDNADHTRSGFPLRMTLGVDGVWRISEM